MNTAHLRKLILLKRLNQLEQFSQSHDNGKQINWLNLSVAEILFIILNNKQKEQILKQILLDILLHQESVILNGANIKKIISMFGTNAFGTNSLGAKKLYQDSFFKDKISNIVVHNFDVTSINENFIKNTYNELNSIFITNLKDETLRITLPTYYDFKLQLDNKNKIFNSTDNAPFSAILDFYLQENFDMYLTLIEELELNKQKNV